MEPARKPGDPLTRVLDGYFEVRDGEFIVGGVRVSDLVESHGSPQFVYDKGVILQKTREVRAILPDRFQLFYSIKANPNAAILDCFLGEGCGLEIASGGELYQALAAGCPADRIVFAGPGKRENELEAAVESAIREIHVESIEEIRSLDAIAMRRGRVCRVALRVNPVGASGGAMRMGGTASPFGIDEEELDAAIDAALTCQHLKICGVHLFMGTQILDAETLIGQYRCAIEIAQRMARRIGPLETIDFGGGWGTPYFAHEQELDLGAVEHGLAAIDRELAADPLLTGATAILEPGRFLINEAGVYLARVIRTKRSRGKVFAVLDGGMHHHLAASGNLGQAMKRNYPMAIVNKLDEPVAEPVEIVGPLCTPLDRIGRSVQLPTIETGDIVGVFLSGAYGRTSSPLGFLSHDAPPEIMAWQGETKVIRRRGEPLDHLRDQAENGKKATMPTVAGT